MHSVHGPSTVSDPELGAGAPPVVGAGRDNKGKRGPRKSLALWASREQRSVSPKACAERGKGSSPGTVLGAPIHANPSCGARTLSLGAAKLLRQPTPPGVWLIPGVSLCPAAYSFVSGCLERLRGRRERERWGLAWRRLGEKARGSQGSKLPAATGCARSTRWLLTTPGGFPGVLRAAGTFVRIRCVIGFLKLNPSLPYNVDPRGDAAICGHMLG